MDRPVFGLTLRNIRGRKLRYALTTFAVILGVAFMSTSFFLTDRIRDSFDELATDITGELDLVIRTSIDGERLYQLPVPDDVLEIVNTDVPEIAAVAPIIQGWNVVPIAFDSDGNPRAVKTRGAPQFGFNYYEAGPLTSFFIIEGRTPKWTGPIDKPNTVGEFILDAKTAEDNNFEIGKTYMVSGQLGNRDFTLVGIFNWRDAESNKSLGATLTVFEERTAQTFLEREGIYDEIQIALRPGVNRSSVAKKIQTDLDKYQQRFAAMINTLPEEERTKLGIYANAQLEVVDSETITEEQKSDFETFINIISNVLLAFAVIAVVVSAFIINNTFSIVLGQRVRELALLRALGATVRQVSRSVILEALLIGIMATLAGLAGGYALAVGLRELLEATGFGNLPGALPIRGRTILIAALVGIGATVLSSLGPARRVRSIAPVAALRDQPGLTPTTLTRRLLIGGFVTIVGIAMLITGMLVELNTRPLLLLLSFGAISTFGGVYMLSPVASKPVANFLGLPIERLFRVPGHLAKENAGRRPRRTAATAAALTIGLALVSLAAVVSDSLKTTFVKNLDESTYMDLFISSQNSGPVTGFSTDLVTNMAKMAETNSTIIDSVISYRWVLDGISVDGNKKDIFSTELAELTRHLDLDLVAGNVAGSTNPGTQGTILVHVDPAEERDLNIGDPIKVTFPAGEEVTLTTAAIFQNSAFLGNWVVDNSLVERYIPQVQDTFASIVYAPGANTETARTTIETFTNSYPQLVVEDRKEFRDSQERQLDQLLSVITIFLGLSLLIAVLGITNTLALSVYEQTRELGLLRAVGMTRRQVRRMVRWEAVIISLFGGLLGVSIGVLFGLAAVAAIPDAFVNTISIPVSSLGQYLLVSALFGILAAILPAYRASRLNVLEAISHE